MHPVMREDALAARRQELLTGTDHRRQLIEAHMHANARNRGAHRDAGLRAWLPHQFTWRRWPRAATDET